MLIQILNLDSSDIKKIIDSGISIHELIFSDREYLRKYLKFKELIISKLEAIRILISEIPFEELQKKEKIESLEEAMKYLKTISRASKGEYFVVLFLNNGNDLVDQVKIKGSIDKVQMDYRLIIKRAALSEATSIICTHNCSSRDVDPSTQAMQDKNIILNLKEITNVFDIRLLDYIIISKDSYYSLAVHNLLQDQPRYKGKNKR